MAKHMKTKKKNIVYEQEQEQEVSSLLINSFADIASFAVSLQLLTEAKPNTTTPSFSRSPIKIFLNHYR